MADLLWKECAQWLTAVGLLPPDHCIHLPDAQVMQLATVLRDGVLLCQLALVLDPNCLDPREICRKPQLAQFYCLKNIRTFIHACRVFFDLKEFDLFEATMLFEYTDFGKVLHTLSKLSTCPKVQKKGIKGFPSVHKNQYFEDEIYKSLEDMEQDENEAANWQAPDNLYSEYHYGNVVGSPNANITPEEVIYEDLCSFRKETQVPVQVPLEKRDYSIRELVETEAKYVEALQIIVRHFMRPLSNYLPPVDVDVIFHKIRNLTEVHVAFHADLLKAINGQAPVNSLGRRSSANAQMLRLPQVLLEYRNRLLIYGPFCANLSVAQQKIDEVCQRSETFAAELRKCQEEACEGKFKLKDLLQVPMQRVLKYHILLKELLRNTTLTHEDHQGLHKAYEAMQDVAEYINEYKRDSENLVILKDLQESIGGWSNNRWPHQGFYGRLRQDGELKVKSHDDSNKLKLRYVFLLDKMLILCKSTKAQRAGRMRRSWAGPATEFGSRLLQNEAYSFRISLMLSEFRVEDPGSKRSLGLGGMSLSRESRWSHFWYLVHRNNKTAYTFYAKSDDKKRKWLAAFEEAMDNQNPISGRATDHVFQMYTFELDPPAFCETCHKLMKGSFYQGYRCGRCGVGCHKACLASSRPCACVTTAHRAPELPPRPPTLAGVPPTTSAPSVALSSPTLNGHTGESSPNFNLSPVQSLVEPWLDNANVFHQSDYANLNLEDYPWYGGIMERDCATHMLEEAPDGTFMLRRRGPKLEAPALESGYALSLKLDSQVRHMRVCQGISEENGRCLFFLSQSRTFSTIMQLVQHYQCQSLQEAFNGLNACLALPWRLAFNTATVLYGYEKQTPESGELSLKEGQIIVLLSTEGEANGWWQGKIGKEIGYFPKAYVRPDTFHGY